jgi:hypothetical protein
LVNGTVNELKFVGRSHPLTGGAISDGASSDTSLQFHIAIELANQRVFVLGGPVGDMVNEVLDLLPASLSESLNAAIIDGVGLDEDGIELVLAKAQEPRGYSGREGGGRVGR